WSRPRVRRTPLCRVPRYGDKEGRAGFVGAEVQPHGFHELRGLGAGSRPREQRRNAAEEKAASGRGGVGGVHEIALVVARFRRTGAHWEGRPGDATTVESLRVRERVARLASCAVVAGARMAARGR